MPAVMINALVACSCYSKVWQMNMRHRFGSSTKVRVRLIACTGPISATKRATWAREGRSTICVAFRPSTKSRTHLRGHPSRKSGVSVNAKCPCKQAECIWWITEVRKLWQSLATFLMRHNHLLNEAREANSLGTGPVNWLSFNSRAPVKHDN